MSTIRDDA
jgi:hypothetical protein